MRFCGIIPFFPCMSRTTASATNMAEHNKWMCALVWGHYRRTELPTSFAARFHCQVVTLVFSFRRDRNTSIMVIIYSLYSSMTANAGLTR